MIGYSYGKVSDYLTSEGYIDVESYKNSLGLLKRKHFKNDLKQFDFKKDYEIWFCPEKEKYFNGFLGLKTENGVVTAKAVGDITEDIFNEKNNYFGYFGGDFSYDMTAVTDYFRKLKKGDAEKEVIDGFSEGLGTYTQSIFPLKMELRRIITEFIQAETKNLPENLLKVSMFQGILN